MSVKNVYIDFETYCNQSIKDVGAWKYGLDPSCEVLCMAYSLDGGKVRTWQAGDPDPEDLLDAVREGALVHAWNATFEYIIWNYVQTHWPTLAAHKVRCTMALAAYHSLPLSLDKAGAAIGAKTTKDKEGTRLIRKFSVPRKPTKSNPNTRILPQDDPEDFARFVDYCATDVKTELAIIDRLPLKSLPCKEQQIFELDLKINERGVKVDVATANGIIRAAAELSNKLENEAGQLMGGDPPIKTSQRAAVMNWAENQGFPLESYQAGYIREVIASGKAPKNVHRVLEIREELAKTSITKYNKMVECACVDERVRGVLQYYGAQRTGRFAGRLIQVQNLPRGTVKGVEEVAPYAEAFTGADWETVFDRPFEAFSSLIRSMLIAGEGRTFYVSDFSNIEGRVLAWLAGQSDVVAQFASGDDLYKHMAATIFGTTYHKVTSDERFVGKQAVLGCGYGMGAQKFLDTCIGYGRDIGFKLAKQAVTAYRKKNNKIVSLWYDVEGAARNAIRQPDTKFSARLVTFLKQKNTLWCKLPSGRCLCYMDAAISDDKIVYRGVSQTTSQWAFQDTYGGKLVENVVQAIARDLMAEAMLRVEKHGYEVLMTIHDEIVACTSSDQANLQEFNTLLCVLPEWAKGCPVAAEGWTGPRYRKD